MTRNTAQLWQGKLPAWDADIPLVCSHIADETHDVKSFFFRSKTPAQFKFLPGQFITLELPIAGQIIHRSYTVSSSPARPHTISITVKRQPNGIVSNWLHNHLKIGEVLEVLPIAGDFSCAHHIANKYLFLSGGSGVTPLMSMSRSFYDLAENQDVVFIHSARAPEDIIFRKELELLAFNQPNFRTAFVCEKAEANWNQPTGYLNIDLLKQIAPDFLGREVFTCGPKPYMEAVRSMLSKASFDMLHYHEESFNFEELTASVQTETKTITTEIDASNFKIEFTKSGASIQCGSDQFVLDAGIAAGMRLPSSCGKGLCGTCKSKLVLGKVDMKHGGGIRQREIDQGFFLPCCSKPLTDLVVEK